MSDAQANGLVEFQQVALHLWKADQQVFGASQQSAKELGEALAKVQAAMPYGDYTKWLKRCGIDRNRANYCVRVANGKGTAKTKKTPEPRFILDGLHEATLAYLKRFASDKGVPLATYVADLLAAHVNAETDTPEHRAAASKERSDAKLKRIRRIPYLNSEVIHAKNWQERTVERLSRLLYIAKPPAATGLAGFVDLFEQVYGADMLPLNWMLGAKGSNYNIGNLLGDHLGGIYKCGTCPGKDRDGAYRTMRCPFGTAIEVGRPDYTDAIEAERILVLENEQKEYEVLHPAGIYKAPLTNAISKTFPDDEPEFFMRERKKRLAATAADNALAAKVAREADAARAKGNVLRFVSRRNKPTTSKDILREMGRVPHLKRLLAKLAKDGELALRDGVFSLPLANPIQAGEVVTV